MALNRTAKIRIHKALWQSGKENVCFYCGVRLSRSTRTYDHVTPQARGGSHSVNNIVLCCGPCNGAKADMTLAEFVDYVYMNGGLAAVRKKFIKKRK